MTIACVHSIAPRKIIFIVVILIRMICNHISHLHQVSIAINTGLFANIEVAVVVVGLRDWPIISESIPSVLHGIAWNIIVSCTWGFNWLSHSSTFGWNGWLISIRARHVIVLRSASRNSDGLSLLLLRSVVQKLVLCSSIDQSSVLALGLVGDVVVLLN